MLAHETTPYQTNRSRFQELVTLLERDYASMASAVGPNHWVFEVATGGQRTQVVHLNYKERPAQELDRPRLVVTSPIGPLRRRIDLEDLLRRNARLDVGAICIEDLVVPEGREMPYLTVRATRLIEWADFDEVWEMLQKVARVADSLEKDLFAHDHH